MGTPEYNQAVLVGNWYEERLAVPQPARLHPDVKQSRPDEVAISFITTTNQLRPLAKVNRKLPWLTASVVPDDGFVL
jgi:hypothetical protein